MNSASSGEFQEPWATTPSIGIVSVENHTWINTVPTGAHGQNSLICMSSYGWVKLSKVQKKSLDSSVDFWHRQYEFQKCFLNFGFLIKLNLQMLQARQSTAGHPSWGASGDINLSLNAMGHFMRSHIQCQEKTKCAG